MKSISTILSLFLAIQLNSSSAFVHSPISRRIINLVKTKLHADTTDRRDWIKSTLGIAAVTGIVANKIAIEGPTPFKPVPSSLDGKVIVITGGNTGLGLESAKRLAIGGATIVITSRSAAKGATAVKSIKEYCAQSNLENENIYALQLDLCDLSSVKDFSNQYKANLGDRKVDVLLNNAGVMAIPEYEVTKDGYEKTFQTNHLGHFALTATLMPLMSSRGARIINVSSVAYLTGIHGSLDIQNLNAEKGYKPWDAYARSKLENILFTKELQRRAEKANINLTAVSLHPGVVRTDLGRYITGEDKYVSTQDISARAQSKLSLDSLLLPFEIYITKGVDRGASTQIWLASGQGENVGGNYYQNCKEVKLLDMAKDMEKANELWSVSETLSGVKFEM